MIKNVRYLFMYLFVDFVKATARSIDFYSCLKNGNQRSIKENITNSYLQNYMRMVLA